MHINAYLRLMRIDKPIGTFLLLWPTWWALWIATQGIVPIKLFCIFTVGVFIMRSAGCVINDIVDRNVDPHVTRTANRPLASGEISLKSAMLVLMSLLLLALCLVLYLNILCFELACIGLVITLIYPFMKRWIAAPQCVLGIAFSLGIPMAFAAVSGNLSQCSWLLWGIGIVWPIIYDTLYAMTDREDDLKIGVHSTAILFGRWDLCVIVLLEIIWFTAWIILAQQWHLNVIFYICWLIAVLFCFEQIRKIYRYHRAPEYCFKAFLNHAWIGLILFMGLAAGL